MFSAPPVPQSSADPAHDRPGAIYALIGAFTYDAPGGASPGAAAQGISVYDTGSLPWQAVQVAVTPNPSFMVLHPRGGLLYTVNEIMHHAGQRCGTLQVYEIKRDPPHLGWVAERLLAPGATGPTHIAIDPDGRHLVISAYTGGQFNLFELDAHGMPGDVCDALASEMTATGRDPERQQAPHPHQALCSPEGRVWICCDLGADTIRLFTLQDARFAVQATHCTAPGAGPRHAAFHPTQAWVYVINELAVTLTGYLYGPAGIQRMPQARDTANDEAEVSLLPDSVSGRCGGSALVMHPSGRWLYASTKGVDTDDSRADSVSAWSIDPTSGALSLLWRHTHDVKGARAMTLSEDGSSLYVLNQTAGTVLRFDIDLQSGTYRSTDTVALAPTPTCLTFSPRPRQPVA